MEYGLLQSINLMQAEVREAATKFLLVRLADLLPLSVSVAHAYAAGVDVGCVEAVCISRAWQPNGKQKFF